MEDDLLPQYSLNLCETLLVPRRVCQNAFKRARIGVAVSTYGYKLGRGRRWDDADGLERAKRCKRAGDRRRSASRSGAARNHLPAHARGARDALDQRAVSHAALDERAQAFQRPPGALLGQLRLSGRADAPRDRRHDRSGDGTAGRGDPHRRPQLRHHRHSRRDLRFRRAATARRVPGLGDAGGRPRAGARLAFPDGVGVRRQRRDLSAVRSHQRPFPP